METYSLIKFVKSNRPENRFLGKFVKIELIDEDNIMNISLVSNQYKATMFTTGEINSLFSEMKSGLVCQIDFETGFHINLCNIPLTKDNFEFIECEIILK